MVLLYTVVFILVVVPAAIYVGWLVQLLLADFSEQADQLDGPNVVFKFLLGFVVMGSCSLVLFMAFG